MSNASTTSGRQAPAPLPALSEEAARAARAARIQAMLERWNAEDCSDEPEWEVAQIEPLRLGVLPIDLEPRNGQP